MYIEILLWLLAIILVLAGLVGLVFPAVPGALLLFAGLFTATWAEDFNNVGAKALIVLGIFVMVRFL